MQPLTSSSTTSATRTGARSVEGVHKSTTFHWVGNGFHVSTYFPSRAPAGRARQPVRADGLRPRQGVRAARPRQARRRLAPAPRLRDGDARLGRLGRPPRQRGPRGRHRPGRRAVDDRRRGHLPRGVPRGGVHPARRADAHDAALGEPPARRTSRAARLPAHHRGRRSRRWRSRAAAPSASSPASYRRRARPGQNVHAHHDARREATRRRRAEGPAASRATTRSPSSRRDSVRAGSSHGGRGRARPLRQRRRAPRAHRRRGRRTSSCSRASPSTSPSSSMARSS